MKKLMIAAAVAAMTVGAFAGACSDPEEELANCYAWDVKMSLKSLQTKKTKCNIAAESECDDPTTDTVYYMDNVTRKLKGYLWVCDYECGADYNVILWDTKYKVSVIAGAPGEYQTIPAGDEVYVYGKKMNKVAGNIQFAGDAWDPIQGGSVPGIDVFAAGVNGKFVQGNTDTDCYIKSLSGNVAGSISWVHKEGAYEVVQKGGLCEDEIIVPCNEIEAKLIPICEACDYCDTWCDSQDNAPELVPATGTWSMKYNKKVSKGGTAITALVPSYAL